MRIFIFIGPTISETECRAHLDATYLPPVSQGDVASLLRFNPDVIGIVDGYFDQVPSVWHKEILLALSKGVRVVGAASMGALRAAELHPFGMEGVGKIFEWYRDGVIDADDEVALRHAPAEFGYIPLSEALVNIRATLDAACNDGAASESTRETLIRLARAMPYWKRTFSSLLEAGLQAGLGAGALAKLRTYCAQNRIDQKKADATALLRHIAALDSKQVAATDVRLEETGYFKGLLDSDVRLGLPGDRSQPTLGELTDFARLWLPDFVDVMKNAGQGRMNRLLANRLGVQVPKRDVEEEETAFRARHQIETEDDLQAWLVRNAATQEELMVHLEEAALEAKVRKMFAVTNNRHTLWELRESGRFESLLAAWQERDAAHPHVEATVSQDELFALYKNLAGDAQSETFVEAALRLGFRNKNNMLAELLKIHQHRPDRTDQRGG